jgi:hypothetical protein
MPEAHTDTLVKPDMEAVLSRTHIGADLHGFLLPTLEAVSNAMHAIENRLGAEAASTGKVEIVIDHANDPSNIIISITDNGIGLNEENYRSFKTPFSGHKLKSRGRGFGRFTAHLKCDFAGCGETATLAGNYLRSWVSDGTDEGLTETSYQALSIIPSPLPFRVAPRVPRAIQEVIAEVGTLFWSDHEAAANRVREVIEAILTDLGVPTLHPSGKSMNLHLRIDSFRKMDGKWAEQADIVEAVKWIGNEGTHDTLTRDDVLDAFDMLETVVEDIYVRTRVELLEKVRATNARHRRANPRT